MNKSIYELIAVGRKYLKLWPERTELLQYFEHYRAVVTARFVCQYFPIFAFLLLFFYYATGGTETLAKGLFYFVFVLSMPVQAMLLMGQQSQKALPPALASWFRQGVTKLKEQKDEKHNTNYRESFEVKSQLGSRKEEEITEQLFSSMAKPLYLDLAQLLNLTYRKNQQ